MNVKSIMRVWSVFWLFNTAMAYRINHFRIPDDYVHTDCVVYVTPGSVPLTAVNISPSPPMSHSSTNTLKH